MKDALIWEVQTAVAVMTVLFDSLLLGTFLGDVPQFMTVVTEVIATSASKEGTLNWTSAS